MSCALADWEAGVAALQAKREPIAPKAKPKAKPRDQTASQKRQSQQSHSPSPKPAGQPQDSDGGPLDREDGAEPPVPIPFGGDHILECCEVSRRDALNELEGWCRSQQGSGLAAVVRCAGGGLSALGRQGSAAWPHQQPDVALGACRKINSIRDTETPMTHSVTSCLYLHQPMAQVLCLQGSRLQSCPRRLLQPC